MIKKILHFSVIIGICLIGSIGPACQLFAQAGAQNASNRSSNSAMSGIGVVQETMMVGISDVFSDSDAEIDDDDDEIGIPTLYMVQYVTGEMNEQDGDLQFGGWRLEFGSTDLKNFDTATVTKGSDTQSIKSINVAIARLSWHISVFGVGLERVIYQLRAENNRQYNVSTNNLTMAFDPLSYFTWRHFIPVLGLRLDSSDTNAYSARLGFLVLY